MTQRADLAWKTQSIRPPGWLCAAADLVRGAGQQSASYSKNSSAISFWLSYAREVSEAEAREKPRFLSARNISEIRDELRRLMEEQVDSLTAQAFGGLSEEESRKQDQRLKRIREVSADLLAAFKRDRKQE